MARGLGSRSGEPGGAAGYALVDTMVAMMVISLAVLLSFQAMRVVSRATADAWEVRRAELLIERLLNASTRTYRPAAGETDGFAWRLETRLTGADRPIEICRRGVSVVNLQSRRTYSAATLETCPLEEPL